MLMTECTLRCSGSKSDKICVALTDAIPLRHMQYTGLHPSERSSTSLIRSFRSFNAILTDPGREHRSYCSGTLTSRSTCGSLLFLTFSYSSGEMVFHFGSDVAASGLLMAQLGPRADFEASALSFIDLIDASAPHVAHLGWRAGFLMRRKEQRSASYIRRWFDITSLSIEERLVSISAASTQKKKLAYPVPVRILIVSIAWKIPIEPGTGPRTPLSEQDFDPSFPSDLG